MAQSSITSVKRRRNKLQKEVAEATRPRVDVEEPKPRLDAHEEQKPGIVQSEEQKQIVRMKEQLAALERHLAVLEGREEPPKKVRNRSQEDKDAKARLIDTLAELRGKRDAGEFEDDVMQISHALILCGLPYTKTSETKITRSARLADGSTVYVTFSTALQAGMPYGSDRSLLHFVLDRAVKSGSRFVSWKSASEFLEAMHMAAGGKNRRDLKDRFERLRGLTIGVERTNDQGSSTSIMPVIRKSHLPTSIDVRTEERGQELLPISDSMVYGIELDEQYFAELKKYHVPTPAAIIRSTRNKSQLQDLMIWLHLRCYAAERVSIIPWEYLRQQLWQEDTNVWRIRTRFAEAITALRVIWPELQAEATKKGLKVGPPRDRKYLIPRGGAIRRLSQTSAHLGTSR